MLHLQFENAARELNFFFYLQDLKKVQHPNFILHKIFELKNGA